MLAAAIAKHIATTIPALEFDAAGVAGNVFVAAMPSSPDVAVMVMPTGGWPQPDFTPERIPTVQLIVRSQRHDPRPGWQLAKRLLEALDGLDLVTLDEGGSDEIRLLGCTAVQSSPASMGMDENRRHEWSLNLVCRIWEPSQLRPG